jgi:peroxin-13
VRQAVHFFITALLQLCDRAGCLYAELARFVLKLLGYNPPPPHKQEGPMPPGFGPNASQAMQLGQAGAGTPAGAWNNVWSGQAATLPRGLP